MQHRHQVEALRSIVVRQWDAERLMLAPWSAADYREACKHKVDVQRFVAQAGQFRCVVVVVPPMSHPDGGAPSLTLRCSHSCSGPASR